MFSSHLPIEEKRLFKVCFSLIAPAVVFMAAAVFFYFDKAESVFNRGLLTGGFIVMAMVMPINFYLFQSQSRKNLIEAELKRIQEKSTRALAATSDGIFEWDLKNNLRYWSPRLKQMIGYSGDELDHAMKNPDDMIHPDDRAIRRETLAAHLKGETEEFSLNFRWKHKDGHYVWVNARGRAMFDNQGTASILTGVCTDITNLKEYEAKLEQARQNAENESRAKSEFLAHMSHELRTPLTAINGVAEILYAKKDQFDLRTGKLLGALSSSAESLRDLLGGILDFSKIESGLLKLDKMPFMIADVFEQIVDSMMVRANEKNIGFIFDYTGLEDFTMVGDRIRLKQILTNLIGNAIKFTETGAVTVQAAMVNQGNDKCLQINVHDTGIGIKPENIKTIFDRFVQADSSVSRKYGGTGLGLPIARQLIVLMGGQLAVTSAFGKGSTFTVSLPLNQPATAVESPPPVPQGPTIKKLKINKKILIVEDYEGTIIVLSQLMDDLDLQYDVARNGVEALAQWQKESYAVILMDIQMPQMDGLTAIAKIRLLENEKNLHKTPAIAMTAHAFSEDRSKCFDAGFDNFLPKPIIRNDLLTAMASVLGQTEKVQQSA